VPVAKATTPGGRKLSEVSCHDGTLSTKDGDRHLFVACACGRWTCPPCARYRRRQLEAELVGGNPSTFITLTWNASRPESPERARQVMGEAWKLLAARIRRRWPAVEFAWGVVVERCESGYPHFHLATRAPYIPQEWLSEQWNSLVGACVVDIRKIRTRRGLAHYLTKYISKDPERIGTGKRYWFSQDYRNEKDSRADRRRIAGAWYWDPEPLLLLVARFLNNGFAIVEQTKTTYTLMQEQPP